LGAIPRFGLPLPQSRFGLRDVALDPTAGKWRNADARLEVKVSKGVTECRPEVAVIAIHRYDGVALAFGGRECLLGSFLRIEGRAEVTARLIGRLERFFDSGGMDIGVRKLVGAFECLSKRQSDGAGQGELRDREVVARDAQVVLLGMELHLRARRVDTWAGARLRLLECLIMERQRIAYQRLLRLDT
jgi:hypothetical protein